MVNQWLMDPINGKLMINGPRNPINNGILMVNGSLVISLYQAFQSHVLLFHSFTLLLST